MKQMITSLALVLILGGIFPTPSLAITTAPVKPVEQYYVVTKVIDGDTFDVKIGEKTVTIRAIGIDTPETVDPRKTVQCFGKEASSKAKEMLLNKKVRLESDSTQGDKDKYGRLLRYAYIQNGSFFNKWMIENGYAYEYTYIQAYKYQKDFKTAQINAKKGQKGLWSSKTCNGSTAQTKPLEKAPASKAHVWYTSSHSTAKFYYCDTDLDWKGLSSKYLQKFTTEKALLAKHKRTLHKACTL